MQIESWLYYLEKGEKSISSCLKDDNLLHPIMRREFLDWL